VKDLYVRRKVVESRIESIMPSKLFYNPVRVPPGFVVVSFIIIRDFLHDQVLKTQALPQQQSSERDLSEELLNLLLPLG